MQPGVALAFIENTIMTLLVLLGFVLLLNRLDKYTHLSSWFSLAEMNFVVNRPVYYALSWKWCPCWLCQYHLTYDNTYI